MMIQFRELKKTVKSNRPDQFQRAFDLAIKEGWILRDGPKWTHGPYGSFKIAFFRKDHVK